jgi:hypothetical protein
MRARDIADVVSDQAARKRPREYSSSRPNLYKITGRVRELLDEKQLSMSNHYGVTWCETAIYTTDSSTPNRIIRQASIRVKVDAQNRLNLPHELALRRDLSDR